MRRLIVCLALTWLLAPAGRGFSQEVGAERRPRFLLASAKGVVPVDVARTPVLMQRLALDLNRAILGEVLQIIKSRTGLRLVYNDDVIPLNARVHLSANNITVAAALTDILLDTGLDVVFRPDGQAALVKRAPPVLPQQGTITGRVSPTRSALAVSDARVAVDGTSLRTTTDAEGRFRLDGVPAGARTLVVTAIGFAPVRVRVQLAAGATATVNIELSPTVVMLDEEVVTGTAFETKRKTVPSPISVLTALDIEQKQATSFTDLLRGEIPGVLPLFQGQYDVRSTIYVRGNASWGTSDVIKIYLDGVEISNPNFISTIDPNSIERIEVVRGPQASTIYGSGAASGVLQVFTKKGQSSGLNRPRIELKTSAGVIESEYKPAGVNTPITQEHTLGVNGGSQEFSYHASGRYFTIGEWLKHYGSRALSFSGGLRAVQGPFTAEFSAQSFDRHLDHAVTPIFWRYPASPACPYCGNPDAFTNQEYGLSQNMMGLNLRFLATPRWQHNLILGDDQTRLVYHQPAPDRLTPADTFVQLYQNETRRRSIRYNTAYDAALGSGVTGRFTVGVDYSSYDVQGVYAGGLLSAFGTVRTSSQTFTNLQNDRWWNAGYFGMAELGFGERLFLTAGTRVEETPTFGKAYGRAVSPRVGAAYVWQAGPLQVKARVAWGKGTRPPPSVARAGSVSASVVYLPNPDIGPEEKVGWDAGLEVYWGRHGSLAVSRYDEEGKNLIQIEDINLQSTPRIRQYQNIGVVGSAGWEVEGAVNVGPLTLKANYVIVNNAIRALSNLYTANPNSTFRVGDRMLDVAEHSGGGTLTGRLWRGSASLNMSVMDNWVGYDWFAYYDWVYRGDPYRGSLWAYRMEYPALVKWNLRAQQAFTERFTAFLRVDNLTNNQNSDFSDFFVAQGRTTVVGVRVSY